MLEDFLGQKEKDRIQKTINENYADMNSYYMKNYSRNVLRKLLKIPFRLGEFYFSYGKKDDFYRRAIDIHQTEDNPDLVKYYQDRNVISKEFPEKCDMVTSAPCRWSKTHWSNERCDKCGRVFPEWN